MDAPFKSRLPESVRRLIDSLEEFAQLPIEVRINPNPARATDPNPDHLAAHITELGAAILIRDESDFPANAVLHELLHIQRFWVEAVPQVMPAKGDKDLDERWAVTGQIENALEHLVIVPREVDYGFDPFTYWNATVRKNWNAYPWSDEAWTRRKNCLLGSLSATFLVRDKAVRDHVAECLRSEGLLVESQLFAQKVRRVLASKPSAVSVVLRFLGIPFEEVGLVAFDVKARTRRLVALPRH